MPILDMMLYGMGKFPPLTLNSALQPLRAKKYYRAYPPVRRFRTAAGTGAYDYSGYIAGDIAKAIHYDKLNAFNDSPVF